VIMACLRKTSSPATWGIADAMKRARLQMAGEPKRKGRYTGFDRWLEKVEQQVTKCGVPPLPRKNT